MIETLLAQQEVCRRNHKNPDDDYCLNKCRRCNRCRQYRQQKQADNRD